jgi:hypothetical protein
MISIAALFRRRPVSSCSDIGEPNESYLVSSWSDVLLSALVSKRVLAVAIAIAVIVLSDLGEGTPAERPDDEPATAAPGSGIIIRSEIVGLWLPALMSDLLERGASSASFESHEALKQFLAACGRTELWYSTTVRSHRADGGTFDCSFVRVPYLEPDSFPEFLSILETSLPENAEVGTEVEPDSQILVRTIPPMLERLDRQEVMALLRTRRDVPGDRARYRRPTHSGPSGE